jgi:hypothetical protein
MSVSEFSEFAEYTKKFAPKIDLGADQPSRPMTVTTGARVKGVAPTVEEIVIAQLIGFTKLIENQLGLPAMADSSEEYCVIPIDDAKVLRKLLAGIAMAMGRMPRKDD